MKAYGYLRVSGRCSSRGMALYGRNRRFASMRLRIATPSSQCFAKEGVSGTKAMESRPALLELLGAVKETGGTVIIEELDRLARYGMVSESILALFPAQGCHGRERCRAGFALLRANAHTDAPDDVGLRSIRKEHDQCEAARSTPANKG